MSKIKTIYMSDEDWNEAKRQSKEKLGKENVSGYFTYLIIKNK